MASKSDRTQLGEIQPWKVKTVSSSVEKQWKLALAAEPELMEEERERLKTRPLDRSRNPRRTHQLKGGLAQRRIGNQVLEQWQHEITGPARIWYCPDKKNRIIYVTYISLSHPKGTEKHSG